MSGEKLTNSHLREPGEGVDARPLKLNVGNVVFAIRVHVRDGAEQLDGCSD